MGLQELRTFFIWLLRFTGLLPFGDTKFSDAFGIIMTLVHVLITLLFGLTPLIYAKNLTKNALISNFWVYPALFWNTGNFKCFFFFQETRYKIPITAYCTTFIINAVQSLIYREHYKSILFSFTHLFDEADRFYYKKRIETITQKYAFIIILMMLFNISIAFIIFGFSYRQTLSSIHYDIFVVLRIYKYIITTDIIKIKLEILHENILSIDPCTKTNLDKLSAKLDHIRKNYENILSTLLKFNECAGYSLLSIITLLVIATICVSFWILLGLLKNINVINIPSKSWND